MIDKYVGRWFLFLILQPSFKARAAGLTDIQSAYRAIRRSGILLWFLGGGSSVLFLLALETRQYLFVFPAIAGVFFFFKTLDAKKKKIADVILYFIEQDFPPDILAKTTLYQLGEVYSETYRIPSLVDTIYHLDKIYRFTLVFSFFLVAYITNINVFLVRQFAFFALFFGVAFIVNMPFFYRRFR